MTNLSDSNPRIYVACLAAYNSGYLHGAWIDADQDADEIRDEIAAMLARSPIKGAEDYAIHDYEGFEGVTIKEFAGIDTVARMGAFIAEHGALHARATCRVASSPKDRPMTRRRTLTVTALAVLGIAAASAVETPTKLIWNATASAPIGFYTIAPAERIEVPEMVAVMPPEPLAAFMAERGYITRGVPLLKRVLGLPGQRVCRTGRTITVNGIEMGEALERDSLGRDLPVWRGCRVIGDGQLFLMNWEVRDSLDGRYFGPTPAASVIGRAVPLWTDEEGVGRYEWRAPTH